MVSLIIEAESGTYIKELISGDGGRTRPSLSELVGVPCNVSKLDVIEIKGE
jgi:tRNA pseudouridine synthase 10